MRKLKQGQTVYLIDKGYIYSPPRPSVLKIFLHSRNQPLPEEGCIIDKWPVDYVNSMIAEYGSKGFYLSRRKATKALKAI
tara:strand:- start:503 stop:742 length:240 start_codon:yes stop_codon:yes gene_type:complete